MNILTLQTSLNYFLCSFDFFQKKVFISEKIYLFAQKKIIPLTSFLSLLDSESRVKLLLFWNEFAKTGFFFKNEFIFLKDKRFFLSFLINDVLITYLFEFFKCEVDFFLQPKLFFFAIPQKIKILLKPQEIIERNIKVADDKLFIYPKKQNIFLSEKIALLFFKNLKKQPFKLLFLKNIFADSNCCDDNFIFLKHDLRLFKREGLQKNDLVDFLNNFSKLKEINSNENISYVIFCKFINEYFLYSIKSKQKNKFFLKKNLLFIPFFSWDLFGDPILKKKVLIKIKNLLNDKEVRLIFVVNSYFLKHLTKDRQLMTLFLRKKISFCLFVDNFFRDFIDLIQRWQINFFFFSNDFFIKCFNSPFFQIFYEFSYLKRFLINKNNKFHFILANKEQKGFFKMFFELDSKCFHFVLENNSY